MEYRENKDVRRPFASIPDARVYFPASSIELARESTSRCLRRGEGVALTVGDSGVGKTLLARVLAAEFETEDLVGFVSASRRMGVKSFLQQLLFSLRQRFVGADETELRLMTFDYLEQSAHERFALFVDDAQNLTLRVFDELRAIIDHCAPALQVSVALFGAPSLEERLNLPSLYSFQQRVTSRSYLDPFTVDEVARYASSDLARVGVNARFTDEAAKLVAERSEGTPRVVAQLCDRALFLATCDAAPNAAIEINERDVERAWKKLQNIAESEPSYGATASDDDDSEHGGDVVEFGVLGDDDSDDFTSDLSTDANVEVAPIDSELELGTAPDSEPEDSAHEALEPKDVETKDETADADVAPAEIVTNADRLDENNESEYNEEESNEEDELIEEDPSSIDSELDARLLAKCGAAPASSDLEDDDNAENHGMKFEIVDEHGNSSFVTKRAPRTRGTDSVFLQDSPSSEFYADANEFKPETSDAEPGYDESLSFSATTSAKTSSRARRPIVDGDDGSRAYREANGFNAEDAARFAADDRHLEEQFARAPEGSPLRDWSDQPLSVEDRAYRQIVASCYRASSDFPASDQYLNELRLLEREIAEEANLIRRIRRIHLQLRSVREPGFKYDEGSFNDDAE